MTPKRWIILSVAAVGVLLSSAAAMAQCTDPEPNPAVAFPNPTCLGTAVQFDANATGGMPPYSQYQWDFDTDLVTFTVDSVAKNPLHVYPAAGGYNAAVRVWDSAGCPSVWRAVPNNPIQIIPNAIAFDNANFVCGDIDCTNGIDDDGDGVIDETYPPLAEVCGDGDAVVEPGEEWDVTVQIQSNLCLATDVRADLVLSATTNVLSTVTNNPGLFGAIPAGGTATYVYRFQVDPIFTKCGNGIGFGNALTFSRFDVVNIQSAEEPFYPPALDAFGVQVGEPYPPALLTTFDDCADPPTSNLGDWTVINGGNKVGWTHAGPGCPSACENALFPTNYYVCDSNCPGWTTTHNEHLISPLIDLTGAETVTLKFDNDYYNYAAVTTSDVNVRSTLTAGAWVTLHDFTYCCWDCDCQTTGTFVHDATGQCADAPDCQFEFYQVTNYYDSWWWAVDQVEVLRDAQCDLVPCGAAVRFDTSFDPTTTFAELCGDGDGDVEADEQWLVTVQLTNIGTAAATSVTADLAVGEATVENNPGAFGNIAPGGTAQYVYVFCMSPQAVCFPGKDIIFDVLNVQSLEGAHPAQPGAFTEPLGGASGTCDNPLICCPCECEASVDVATVCLGTPQTFIGTANASCVTEPLGILYRWDFESDSKVDATGALVGHTYPVPGLYTVTLQITDSDVPPAVTTCTVDVNVLAAGVPDVSYDTGFNPPATLTELCGDGDPYVEPEERWLVTVQLINNSPCTTAKNVQADLTINAGSTVSAAVQNPGVYLPVSIVPFGTAQATYCISPDTMAVCINDITFDVTNITSDEGAGRHGYADNLLVFDVTVGGLGAGQTRGQQDDPLEASNGSATSDLTPAFSLAAPVDMAELDFDLTYVPFVPTESATTAIDYRAKGMVGESCENTKTGMENEPLAPDFTLAAPAEHFIIDYSISHSTDNVQTCTKVSIVKPDASECLLKDYGDPVVTPIDRPLCYIGPGTYQLRLCEDETQGPKCGAAAQIAAGGITATVILQDLGGNATANAQVELCDPSAVCTTLKPYGAVAADPYDVTGLYAGPGVYQIRVSENTATGGEAVLTAGAMFAGDIQCDVSGCAPCTVCVGLACTVFADDPAVCLGTPQTYTVTTVGGFPPFTYEWDFDYDGVTFDVDATGAAPPPYAQPSVGTYTVACRVTDSCPQVTICTVAGITVNPNPTSNFLPPAPSICAGGCVGLDANPAGGTPPYTFLWSTGETSQVIIVCPVVTTMYDVTVTDSNGCAASSSKTVTVNNPAPTIAGATTRCANDPCTPLDAGAGYTGYLWSPSGETTQTICVTPVTTTAYSVTATDDLSASYSSSPAPVAGDVVLAYNSALSTEGCPVFDIMVYGPLADVYAIGFQLSYDETILEFLNAEKTTALDDGACSGACVLFIVSDLPNLLIVGMARTVPGAGVSLPAGANALMRLTFDAVAPGSFAFGFSSNGVSDPFGFDISGAWYAGNATVTSSISCSGTSPDHTLTVNPNPTVTVSESACSGSDRDLTANPAGGSGVYTGYLWAPGGETTQVITVAGGSGPYTVTVTDDNTCQGTSAPFNASACAVCSMTGATASAGGPTTFCDGGSVVLTATPTGGTGPFTYLWAPGGETTQTISVTANGAYSCEVTDTGEPGCVENTNTVVVTVNPLPTPVITEACGVPTPADSTLDAGAGYVFYLWSTGAKSQTISVPCGTGASYTVTVLDGNGCIGTSPPLTVCGCGQLDELEVQVDSLAGGSWLILVHDAAATQYNVYANTLSTFGAAGDEYGSPNGAVLPSVCNVGFTPSGGTATVDYPGVLPDDSWILITAATASAGSESTLGVDSAGTERNTVGTWTMCGP